MLSKIFKSIYEKLNSRRGKHECLALEWTKTSWNLELWKTIKWMGVPILQWPTDLIILQEIIFECKPKFIIETGTYQGGTAVYFASLLRLLNNNGKVISIDISLPAETRRQISRHPLGKDIILYEGDSASAAIEKKVRQELNDEKNILVFIDSDHGYEHVFKELQIYSKFVPVGGYLCAFDTIVKDLSDMSKGRKEWLTDNPARAVTDFLKINDDFIIDKTRNRLLVTWAPDGFLKRIK